MSPIISLVITVYNRERYLSAAIESILAQTRGDFELLIWDDGSTDSSPEIAREYEKRDCRVRVVVAENQGQGLALKAASSQTTAPYIGWVDSDDLLAPTALAETAGVLDAQPEIGWVYTDYLDIDEQDNILSYGYRCLVPYSREELLNRFMTFHFRLIRREVFDLVGGIDDSLKIAEDYDLCLRLSEVAQVQHIFKPLYYYRTHAESMSRQRQQEQIREAHKIITKAQKRRKSWLSSVAASILPFMLGFMPNFAQAQSITPGNDGTGTVVNTQGNNIDISGGSLSSDRTNLFHSFSQFGVDAKQTANFLSQPSIQNILGRVTGGNASLINGLITVTGGNANLYLINPAGIIFGANSSLNVPASFTATTANGIGFDNHQWFNAIGANNYSNLNGNPTGFAFTTSQPGSIFNAGNLGVGEGQNLMLLGGTVINTGTVSAANGNITIMAVPGEKLVRITPANTILSLDLPIETKAEINPLPFSPLSLPALLTGGNLNSATGVTVENGVITLTSTNTALPTDAGTTIVSGQVSVANPENTTNTTPQINILGDRVALLNANLNASGINGGTVLIGGDYQGQGTVPNASRTFVSSDSVINADGLENGNGGKVIIWADDTTRFFGTITAKGGNGGLVETSGKNFLDVTGAKVDAGATNGQPGTWLLDPTNINIINGGNGTLTSGIFNPSTSSNIDPLTIESALNSGTNVSITTNGGTGGSGDITLTDSINQTIGGNASLTLTARQFLNPYGRQINMNSTGDLTFNLNQVNPNLINAPTSSIQNAIDVIGTVAGNTTINLGAGTYTGSTIYITKALTLNGAGATNTIIDAQNQYCIFEISSTGTVTMNDFAIFNGKALSGYGGAINNSVPNILNVNNIIFSGNSAIYGGSIYNQGGDVTVNNSTFSGNSATDSGGGIYNSFGYVTVNNSTFSGNSATNSGGGIYNEGGDGGTVIVNNSTFSGNSATNSGGGIYNSFGDVMLNNSTFGNNSASNGGGFYAYGGAVNVNSSTFSLNSASSNGGGIYRDIVGATVTLKNTIVAGNTSATNPDVFGLLDTTSSSYNLIGDGTGTGISNGIDGNQVGTATALIDPKLSILGDYGGSTQTFALLPGSPAIDAGIIDPDLTTDQRGIRRPQGTTSDIGAFELVGYNLTPTAGSGQSTTVNSNFSTDLQAQVTETGFTKPVSGITVNFIAPSSGATANFTGSTTLTTDSSGIVSIPVTANTVAGSYSISANSGSLTPANFSLTNNPDVAASIIATGGTPQTTVVNTAFANSLQATVKDQYGNLISNATVNFIAPSSGATANFTGSTTLTTDSSGIVSIPVTANIVAGSYSVSANSGSLTPANFSLTNNPDVAASIIATGGTPQATVVNTAFANSLQATVKDQYGNLISNATVNFIAPSSGATANFTGSTTLTTDSSGIVSIPVTANIVAGSYSISANSGSLTPANFSLTNNPDVAASIIATGGTPQATVVNTAFANSLQATVKDQYGNLISNATVNFIAPSSGATANFTGSTTLTTDSSGIVSIPVTANIVAGSYSVSANSGSLTPANFSLTNNPDVAASIIATGGTPQATVVNTAFANSLQATVKDQYGNLISNATVNFIAPSSGATANFTGSTTLTTDSSGIVSIPVTANIVAGSYSVSANSGSLTPANFSLTNNPDVAASIIATGGTPQATVVNTAFANSLQATVKDQYGNLISNATVNFIAPSSGATANFTGSTTLTTDSSGIVSIPVTANIVAGSYSISANSGSLTPANFSLTNNPDNYPNPEQLEKYSITKLPLVALPIEANTAAEQIDGTFTNQFQQYLGITAKTEIKTDSEARDILQKIDNATGIKPALIYVNFVPESISSSDELPKNQPTTIRSSSDRLELLVVTSQGKSIRKVLKVTRSQILAVAQTFKNRVTDPELREDYKDSAKQLYDWLITPIETELQERKISNLVFLMDTGLRSLPLAALYDGQQYLVERYSVGLMPSLSLSDTDYVDIKKAEVLVLGMGASKFANQSPLPAVPTELKTITPRLWQGKSFLNEAFTLKNLQTQRQQTPFGIIHLATHGEFKPGAPSNSYIQLWDTQLRMDRIRELGWNNPPVQLVVLSACRSALGDENAELGFAGFAIQAGAKSALASLWYVSDEGTLGLMSEFYEQLRTAPIKAEALRQTQVAMLKGQVQLTGGKLNISRGDVTLPPILKELGDKNLQHPYFWSAFTLIGNPW